MTDTQNFHNERNPQLLSYSGISLYLNCRYKWKVLNVYGLKTGFGPRALELGTAVHEGLAYYLAGKGTIAEGVTEWQDREYAKIPKDEDTISLDGFVHSEDAIWDYGRDALIVIGSVLAEIDRLGLKTYVDASGPWVERELTAYLENWDGFAGHIDWIAVDGQGRLWVVDFKTRKTFYDDASEDVNIQNALYQYLALAHGLNVSGTITLQVRSDVPKRPKVNKDGTVSRAKIVTTWDVYRQTVVDAGQDPSEYEDMRLALSTVEWTKSIVQYRSVQETAIVWDSIVEPLSIEMAIARDRILSRSYMDNAKGNRVTVRNMNHRNCNGCSIRDVCLAGLKGYDVLDVVRNREIRDRDSFEDAAKRNLL